jgi:hypothetical protein
MENLEWVSSHAEKVKVTTDSEKTSSPLKISGKKGIKYQD